MRENRAGTPHAGWSTRADEPPGPYAAKPLAVALGARLQRERLRAGLSQTALARRVAVARPTVGRWERGERLPPLPAVYRLAAVLGIAVRMLLPTEDEAE
ncbi:MAG: helix-turn-helix transcriptional regulator [Thermomicrobiales bacterium]|nr:helix-turn-helix transcriptional regulator [Thermomicrobiales bacterium]